jgi:hypothetical protein
MHRSLDPPNSKSCGGTGWPQGAGTPRRGTARDGSSRAALATGTPNGAGRCRRPPPPEHNARGEGGERSRVEVAPAAEEMTLGSVL